MQLEHKPGSVNAAADALSRAPLPVGQRTEEQTTTTDSVVLCVADNANPSMLQVQQEQSQDPALRRLIEFLRNETLPENPSEAQ